MDGDGIPNIAYVGMIFPLAGMSIGALAVWTEHRRKEKALEVLKTYAERGEEPPASVLDAMRRHSRAQDSGSSLSKSRGDNLAGAAFFFFLAIGFGLLTAFFYRGDHAKTWFFIVAFSVPAFALMGLSAAALVRGLNMPKTDGR